MAKAKRAERDEDVESTIDRDEDERDESDEDESPGSRSSGPVASAAATQALLPASSVKNVFTIAVRELRSYFDSLVAYVVLGGTMLLLGLYFFTDLPISASFWRTDRATMLHMFQFMPWALGLVVPLVSMRALAEERRSGTLELLITMPVRDSDVILGKYIGAFAMLCLLFLATLLYPIAMFKWPWSLGALDWGPVTAGYVGVMLYTLAALAVGLFFSSITDSQIIAFFLTAVVLQIMNGASYLVEELRGGLGDAISFVSFASRFEGFERGVVDTKAIVYFLSIALLFLLLAFRSLESRKWK